MVYRVLLLFQRTRAVRILLGLLVLVGAYLAAYVLKLSMITQLLGLVFQYGAIALLIVFHPELRSALAHLGRTRRLFRQFGDETVAQELSVAADRLSRLRIGAIIAVEHQVRLDEYVQTGVEMHARVSADLLVTIFTPHSPLHDGAVVVRGENIIGAGGILPLSQSALSDRALGTRHRAALGLAEETDAAVIVISEESGAISLAAQGRLWRGLSTAQLREKLAGPIEQEEDTATAVGLSA